MGEPLAPPSHFTDEETEVQTVRGRIRTGTHVFNPLVQFSLIKPAWDVSQGLPVGI